MAKPLKVKLPRVAVDDKTEKVALTMTVALHAKVKRFEEFFTEHAGQKPSSFNALLVGILEEYVDGNRDFHKWRKAKDRGSA